MGTTRSIWVRVQWSKCSDLLDRSTKLGVRTVVFIDVIICTLIESRHIQAARTPDLLLRVLELPGVGWPRELREPRVLHELLQEGVAEV